MSYVEAYELSRTCEERVVFELRLLSTDDSSYLKFIQDAGMIKLYVMGCLHAKINWWHQKIQFSIKHQLCLLSML